MAVKLFFSARKDKYRLQETAYQMAKEFICLVEFKDVVSLHYICLSGGYQMNWKFELKQKVTIFVNVPKMPFSCMGGFPQPLRCGSLINIKIIVKMLQSLTCFNFFTIVLWLSPRDHLSYGGPLVRLE